MFNIFKKEQPVEEQKSVGVYDTFYGVASQATNIYNSALSACLSWGQRSITAAELVLEKWDGKTWVDQPLPLQLQMSYDGLSLLDKITATYTDHLKGDSYWLKLRKNKKVVGYQFIPNLNVTIQKTADNTKVEYYVINNKQYSPNDVIHFKFGIDPSDHLMGYNKEQILQSLNTADYWACEYQAALLKSPTPSFLAMPGDKVKVTDEVARKLSMQFKEATSAKGAGSMMVTNGDFKFEKLGFSPADLNIAVIADFVEERICAVLGIPQQVIGLGENKSTYSNMREANKMAAQNHTIPILNIIADSIFSQTPEVFFEEGMRLRFKTEDLEAMQEDFAENAKVVGDLFSKGVISRGIALSYLGYDPKAEDYNIYNERKGEQNTP